MNTDGTNTSSADVTPRASLAARLKDNRYVFIGLTVTLVVITTAYYVILRGREMDPALVNNQILLFFLRNVNAVLVTALAFVLIRNLTKLWFEYRGKRLGAKLETKLVVTYIGLSLIPVLLLFALATEVVQGSLDHVFRTETADLIETGYEVSVALSSQIEHRNQVNAALILESIGELPISDNRTQPRLDRVLKDRLSKLEVDVIYAFQETEFIHAVINPTSGLDALPEIDQALLLAALRGGRMSQVQQLAGEERLLLGAAASEVSETARAVIVAGTVLPEALAQQTRSLLEAGQASRQVLVQESEIRAVQTLTFVMVALVLLLTCSWVGLYLARQVTVPIQALAEGTRRIAHGDLEHRVDAPADDELGVLVNSFNKMTGELQRSKGLLEESNRDLVSSNTALERARQRIGTVLRSVSTGVISIDGEGRITTCNDAAGTMLGLDPHQLEGKALDTALSTFGALSDLLAPKLEEEDDTAESLLALEGGIRSTQQRVNIDNEWKTFEVSSTPMLSAEEITGRVIVLEDLTELIRAQKLATWNEAARRIAHEIKNPLTPIKLSAERLLKKHAAQDPSFGDTLTSAVNIIVREVEKMKNLVDEFARFARMPQPNVHELDAGQMCRDVAALYANIKQGVEVVALTESDDDANQSDLLVNGDEAQLRSAVINLIDNAVEATSAPGTIVVRAQKREDGLRLQVADPGPGVKPEDKERLFLPYYSTKGRGTGLGLSIVHRIVTDHGGTIRIDDNQPTGAVFTIDLPS